MGVTPLALMLALMIATSAGCSLGTDDTTGTTEPEGPLIIPPLPTSTTSSLMAEGPVAPAPGVLASVPLPTGPPPGAAASPPTPTAAPAPTAPPPPAASATRAPGGTTLPTRPSWLGTRVLALRPDGFGEMPPTPPELADRRFATIDFLAPPTNDTFVASIVEVPPEVVARSSWRDDCPVGLAELRYVTVSFHGFDGLFHTGELLVNADAAEGFVEVFRRLHEARFPIEEMRVVTADEIDAPPTGDGNNTSAFACRPATGATNWSQHAYGRAIDVNPFINPYLKGDIVLPELASVYLDRADVRPGMIVAGDVVTTAFADIGWAWGGNWNSLKDWQHFSANGR